MRHLAIWSFCSLIFLLSTPGALGQVQAERAVDATVLLRTASFGAHADSPLTYVFSEYQPDRWIVWAQNAPPSTVNWMVLDSPMGGANAGYIRFANSKKEVMTLDVLKIDACYGPGGDIRIGW